MITAKEARNTILANPSFDRKVELYNQVTDIINKTVDDKGTQFVINEEQHLALSAELLEKGYQQTTTKIFTISFNGPIFTYKF